MDRSVWIYTFVLLLYLYLSVQLGFQDNFRFPHFGRKSPPFMDPIGLDQNSNLVIEFVIKGKSFSYLFIFLQVKIKIFHSHVERYFISLFLFIAK